MSTRPATSRCPAGCRPSSHATNLTRPAMSRPAKVEGLASLPPGGLDVHARPGARRSAWWCPPAGGAAPLPWLVALRLVVKSRPVFVGDPATARGAVDRARVRISKGRRPPGPCGCALAVEEAPVDRGVLYRGPGRLPGQPDTPLGRLSRRGVDGTPEGESGRCSTLAKGPRGAGGAPVAGTGGARGALVAQVDFSSTDWHDSRTCTRLALLTKPTL